VKRPWLRFRHWLPFLVFALFFGVSVNCFAGPCGGNGQRACCNGDGEFSDHGVACNGGLAYSTAQGCIDPNGCSCSGGIITSESSGGMCYQPTGCGGQGQRACCNGAAEFSNDGLACNSGLVQIPGGCGPGDPGCVCGGPSTNGLFPAPYASGNCVQPSACGGEGQRACCNGLVEFSNNGTACNSGLTEVPGCSGDCTCGGTTSLGEPDGNSCTSVPIAQIPEPATNANPAPNETGLIGSAGSWSLQQESLPSGPECPPSGLCGYSDLHVHMFANLAHGGATLAGEAWDPNGVNVALGEDYGSNLALLDKNGNPKPRVDVFGAGPSCPPYLLDSGLCRNQVLFHGDHTAFDTVTGGDTNDGAAANFGAPLFSGWPLWTSTIHQQVYYKWLERAWLGGLRLMVMDAVTNEALCKSGTRVAGTDCALSMTPIDAQLQAALDFQTWLDSQYGGPGDGWFRIVTTPGQAESVIKEGKLAVVLGIEVDNLFNCHFQNASGQPLNGEGPACDEPFVQQELQKYYAMGVRHIFPIHNFDNAYGSPAAWQDAINAGNRAGEGVFWAADNCTDPGYGFSLDATTDGLLYLAGFGGNSFPVYPAFTSGSCHNTPGLTSLGSYLVQQAMNMGMIIDVDHMSIHAFNDTIDLANRQSPVYAGIAATHVQFFDLYSQSYGGRFGRHERMRTQEQLQRIKDLGGMIAAMLKDDTQDTGDKGWCLPQGNCPFGALTPWPTEGKAYTSYPQSCNYSTTEWAQAYRYGVRQMDGAPVAMGSDFNGIAGHVGPRFGNGACGGSVSQRAFQERLNNRLAYPFTIPGFGTFDRQVSGQKSYDFNVDGLAHIGLLPDLVADLKNVGLSDGDLQPLFGSAQAYINMWSAVFRAPAPNVSLSGVPATAAYQSKFTVTTDNHGTTTSVPTITTDPSSVCTINGNVVTMVSATGTCSVTATWAADGNYAKASITQKANATKIAPTVTFTGAPATAAYGSQFAVSATTNATTVAVITATAGGPCSVNGTTVTITSGTGVCSLRATWAADSNYDAAQLTQTTSAAKFAPRVDLSVNGAGSAVVAAGATVTFVARIHAASPTSRSPDGSITISDSTHGFIQYGSAPIMKDPNSNDGLATITNSTIPVGSYVLVGTYGGDNQAKYYNGAQSNTVTLQVQNKLGQTPQPSLGIQAARGARDDSSLQVLLTVTNDGTAPALGIDLRRIVVRSLSGYGKVELLTPTPPVMLGNLNPGKSTTLSLELEVPARVKTLRLHEHGRFRDEKGKPYEFNLEQVLGTK
jgi:microsomal dipeptidase-like Zn-dependent dipeptidase